MILPDSPQQDPDRSSEPWRSMPGIRAISSRMKNCLRRRENRPRSPVVTPMTGTLKDRKRIIVIRRASSRDTAIPLADERRGEDEAPPERTTLP